MGGFSLVHWIILGIVILLLFGGNRFSAMMGDVAKGLKSFKQGMADDDKPHAPDPRQIPPQQNYVAPPIDVTPQPRPADPTSAPPPPTSPPTDDSAH
jgi:sec-independent protein translocase protein TatA